MRKIVTLSAVFAATLILSACGETKPAEEATTTEVVDEAAPDAEAAPAADAAATGDAAKAEAAAEGAPAEAPAAAGTEHTGSEKVKSGE